MGRALYRKHRSKTLDEVVGQQHITDTLQNALKIGAINHAYLFTGPRGVGKTSIARIFAHEINDIKYDDEAAHLDIIEIDAASNRRIDEIRELRDKVHVAPTSSKYKVYIIDEVHMLTREAFNALLKTLEEPPEHAVFILATTESHKIPDTIISRTQRFNFKPITPEDASKHLKHIAAEENIEIDDDAVSLIAQHGNGSFRDSISILDQLSAQGKKIYKPSDVNSLLGMPDEEIAGDIVQAIVDNDSARLFSLMQTLREQGIDVSLAARAISRIVRDSMINESLTLQKKTSIRLLKDLLPLSTGSSDFIALELCLLGVMELDDVVIEHPAADIVQEKPIKKARPKSPEVQEIQAAEKKEEIAPKADKKPEEKPTPIADDEPEEKSQSPSDDLSEVVESKNFSQETWKQLLDDMKGKHNTLYGILRMAAVSEEDGKIVMEFAFGFHKKRVESPQSSAAMRKFMRKYFGKTEYSSIVKKRDKAPDVKSKKMTKTEESSPDISSVSNIFGGAELLES